jgi:tRNA/tmRNA/rRNA uracil-C5-methylase (TrmA/RlmC/RlmD family)
MKKGAKINEQIRMTVETVAFGGDGVGRPGGLVTFVPFTVDGDEVVVEITERRSRYAQAVLREVLSRRPTGSRLRARITAAAEAAPFSMSDTATSWSSRRARSRTPSPESVASRPHPCAP